MAERAILAAAALELDAWPDDVPFPLSAVDCLNLCRGHAVRWHGSVEEAKALPGRYELLCGWLILTR